MYGCRSKSERSDLLRHSYATLLLENGIDLKTVSERLGHTSIKITADLYGHVTPRMRSRATDVMDIVFQTVQKARTPETTEAL